MAVDKELDCVSQQLEQGVKIGWADVCYTQDFSKSHQSDRMETVNQALDSVEREQSEKTDHVQNNSRENPVEPALSNFGSGYSVEFRSQIDLKKNKSKVMTHGSPDGSLNIKADAIKSKLKFYAGYRKDDLKWNIAGTPEGTSPNILSELTWADLEMTEVKARSQTLIYDHFRVDLLGKYAEIYRGNNQDSDYAGDDRTSEFSRSNNHTNDKNAMDFSVDFGYKINIGSEPQILPEFDSLWLSILAGYSYDAMRLQITDGNQTIPATGSFPNLHSTYNPEWKGPWIGFELEGEKKRFSGLFRFEYHLPDYYAQADWNLRSEFQHPKSFEHIADTGRGLIFELEGSYKLNERWNLTANADIQRWGMDAGLARVFLSDGTEITTRLNEVEWKSFAVMFGAVCAFP